MSNQQIISKSSFGPISLDEYIETRKNQYPENIDFYEQKKKEILLKYPNIYELVENRVVYSIDKNKQRIVTNLEITCRVKDITRLEYRPYNNYRKDIIDYREKHDNLEKSKYVPPSRDRFIK